MNYRTITVVEILLARRQAAALLNEAEARAGWPPDWPSNRDMGPPIIIRTLEVTSASYSSLCLRIWQRCANRWLLRSCRRQSQ